MQQQFDSVLHALGERLNREIEQRKQALDAATAMYERTPDGLVEIPIGSLDDDAWAQGGLYDGDVPLRWAFDAENLYLRLDGWDGARTEVYLGVPSADAGPKQ